MDIFNNKEIRRMIKIYILVSLMISVIALFFNFYAFVFVLVQAATFYIIYIISVRVRYKNISILSSKIDKILHGDENINFNEYNEGELSILSSELSKMTFRLKKQAQQLQNDKVFLSQSIADISHQIRTPLTSINLIVDMLRKRDLPTEKRLSLVNDLSKLLSQIDWQINALLKLSKLDADTIFIKREPVNVNDLLESCLEQFAITMDINCITCEKKLNGNETYTGDKEWTKEAINNIIKNCIEHAGLHEGVITIECYENPIYTEISISDNGCGIDEEDMPHVFERFYKGKNSSPNSVGIGLSLAKTIIMKQNGTIKVEQNKPKGTRFVIRFYKETV